VHGEKCYMCSALLTLKTMEVDHIVPESLVDQPEALTRALAQLGRPPDFDLNSYENWLPSCASCNGGKSDRNWDSSLLVQQHLQRAQDRAPRARALAEKTISMRQVHAALNVLERASEDGELAEDILEALGGYQRTVRDPETALETFHVTPRYTLPLHEVLRDDGTTKVVRGPYGVGGGPSGIADPRARCAACGNQYFNGARCVSCGMMDDDF
jgi:hypothetical protein